MCKRRKHRLKGQEKYYRIWRGGGVDYFLNGEGSCSDENIEPCVDYLERCGYLVYVRLRFMWKVEGRREQVDIFAFHSFLVVPHICSLIYTVIF
jgi:hypothetical protein